MNLQIKQQQPPMEHVGLRLPKEIRERAKAMARELQADESKVYRTIIEEFFLNDSDTDCIQKEQVGVARSKGGKSRKA